LQAGNPGDGDLLNLNNPLPTVDEGLNWYTITVTPQDGTSPSKTYAIKVVKLPNLSLKDFKVKKDSSFERDLALVDTQDVLVADNEGLTIVATPVDGSATVSQSPSTVPTLGEDTQTATPVTVTVSRNDFNGVPGKYTSKTYVVNLYWAGSGVDLTPWAKGGIISFIPDGSGNLYEAHTFYDSGTLLYTGTASSIKADYLIVAGGGGAGGSSWNRGGGGGGAGGLLYTSAGTLSLDGGSVSVTVGAGGKGGTGAATGSDGGSSSIGDLTVPGGGGGGGSNESGNPGKPGGSGGGGGSGAYAAFGIGGSSSTDNGVLGNSGGAGGKNDQSLGGGGGGGAGGPGADATTNTGTPGGNPWIPNAGAAWVTGVTGGVNEFSRGGNGGNQSMKVWIGANGTELGDGGSGGGGGNTLGGVVHGGTGHKGIVVIRFLRSPENTPYKE
jgi:hypothetical protein